LKLWVRCVTKAVKERVALDRCRIGIAAHPRPVMLAVMNVPKDAPTWLVELVGPLWGAPEWSAWEDYREKLPALGVPANMLKPIGPLSRPTDISGHVPSLEPWVSVPIDWQRFGDRDAPLHALGDLVTEIAKTTT